MLIDGFDALVCGYAYALRSIWLVGCCCAVAVPMDINLVRV